MHDHVKAMGIYTSTLVPYRLFSLGHKKKDKYTLFYVRSKFGLRKRVSFKGNSLSDGRPYSQ